MLGVASHITLLHKGIIMPWSFVYVASPVYLVDMLTLVTMLACYHYAHMIYAMLAYDVMLVIYMLCSLIMIMHMPFRSYSCCELVYVDRIHVIW